MNNDFIENDGQYTLKLTWINFLNPLFFHLNKKIPLHLRKKPKNNIKI